MTIKIWNIRHGGGKRLPQILDVFEKEKDSDIFVLTEFRNNQNRTQIEEKFTEFGFKFLATTESEPKLNSVFIASKIPFQAETFDTLGKHQQRILKMTTSEFILFGCYFPIKNEKKILFDFLLDQISQNKDQTIIITGDLNTGQHFLDEKGATFYHSEYFEEFEKSGLKDAWRDLNKDKRAFSWFSHKGNGFRLDHFFIDKKVDVKRCFYNQEYRIEKISDHALMTLEVV